MVPARGTPPFVNWDRYLLGKGHSSYNQAAVAITTGNAEDLTPAWTWFPDATDGDAPRSPIRNGPLDASPTVHDGTIYIGTTTGYLYALDESHGTVEWKRDMGYSVPCPIRPVAMGLSDTATVATDPTSSQTAIYLQSGPGGEFALAGDPDDVAGSDGGVYLNALTPSGALLWRVNVTHEAGSYAWSSPVVTGGHVYVGIGSFADCPLVRGGIREFDQHTGTLVHTYWATPVGTVGASVWTTPVTDGTNLWVTLGNGRHGDSYAIVRLSSDLKKMESWTPPDVHRTDDDFGGSPILFSTTGSGLGPVPLVGACDKNGYFYAFRRLDLRAGPYWTRRVSENSNDGRCLVGAVWNAPRRQLLVGGPRTRVGDTTYPGSIRRLDPATGKIVWQRGLPGRVIGTPTMDGSNVLAVATYEFASATNVFSLRNATTGGELETYDDLPGTKEFAQPVFADTYLFRTLEDRIIAYAP
ncbi:MAG: PQQ-binding-like beta-propeller repeat protein [Actinomycetota bacterium]